MTKNELITELARVEGITFRAAELAVNATFKVMENTLASGDRIEIRGFGSFKIKEYEGYEGRNPRTLEKVKVGPKKLPFFKVGKELARRINSGESGDDDSDT